jgi:hypothetical protein
VVSDIRNFIDAHKQVDFRQFFFERLAGKVALPDDPFKGLRPALPRGDAEAEKGMTERSRESG